MVRIMYRNLSRTIARTLCNLQLAISKRYLVKNHLAVETISDKFRSRQTGETKHPSNSRGQ